jgi:hypothetical protein
MPLATLQIAAFRARRFRVPITRVLCRPSCPRSRRGAVAEDSQREAKPIQQSCALEPRHRCGSRPSAESTRHRPGCLNDHGDFIPVTRAAYWHALVLQQRIFTLGPGVFFALCVLVHWPRRRTRQDDDPLEGGPVPARSL